MPAVLFVCTANRFRSPLAAAVLTQALAELGILDAWRVGSAGTWAAPGQPVLNVLAEAAQELDLDLSAHRSARVDAALLASYDLILVMESSQKEALLSEFRDLKERVYLLSEVVERRTYDIPDLGPSEEEARQIASELVELVRRGRDHICIQATYHHNTRQKSRPNDE